MMAANARMTTMPDQTQFMRRTAADLLACSLIASLLPAVAGVAVAAEQDKDSHDSTVELDGYQTEAELRADAEKVLKKKVEPFVKKYCLECHGTRPEAGINLKSALDSPGAASSTLHWKKAVANVKVHDMPPDDADKIPTNEERLQFIEWIGKIKYLAQRDPGPFVIRRLSKVEYANTLHDLYGVDRSIADSLPEEVVGEGYLNSISPLQSELYLDIANKVIDQVVAREGQPPTEVQKRLFGELPANEADPHDAARKLARSLARDAYRRPPTEKELDVLVGIFDLGRENKLSHTASLSLMLKAILVSPQFLFITPAAEADSADSIVPLDDYQLASRLSYLLWSTPPDAELSGLADRGKLRKPEVLRAQVKRLLEHPRSRALFDGFGAQWLGVGGLEDQTFDPNVFPQMTPALRKAMVDEARLFFESIVRENQTVFRFVDSDYTFLNGPACGTLRAGRIRPTVPRCGGSSLRTPTAAASWACPARWRRRRFPTARVPSTRRVGARTGARRARVPPPPPNVPAWKSRRRRTLKD